MRQTLSVKMCGGSKARLHDLSHITCEHLVTMAAPDDEAGALTYGPTRALVLGLRLSFVGLLIIGAVQIFDAIEHDRVSVLSGFVFYVAINAVAFLGFVVLLRPRIIVSANGVTIVNYVSTKRLKWDDIKGFSIGSGYLGIWVHLSDGKILIANAVQKSNYMMWVKRPARADRVVTELNAELARRS
jgi:hypothetical protein